MGRTDKLTPERHEKIIQALELGLPFDVAAGMAGVDTSTVWRWRKRGDAAKSGKFRKFRNAVLRAEVKGEANLALIWRQAAQVDAKLARSWLARRWPQRWARRTLHGDEPVDTNITVTFNRPEPNPDEHGDDLVMVSDVDDKNSNGGNGK